MFYCSNCGASVSPGAQSCPNCHGLFGGTGQGTAAQQAEQQKRYQQTLKADQVRQRRVEREHRHDRRSVGSQKRWNRVAHRNAGALQALEGFCVAVARANHSRRPAFDTEPRAIDFWVRDVAWLETPPHSRNPKMSPDAMVYGVSSLAFVRQLAFGPRHYKYPTRKAIRHIEKGIIRSECNPVLGASQLNYEEQDAKKKLDSLL